jgi:hypothetical protein
MALIADVRSGHADFEFILVYDVSRWGRFQLIALTTEQRFAFFLAIGTAYRGWTLPATPRRG